MELFPSPLMKAYNRLRDKTYFVYLSMEEAVTPPQKKKM